MNYYGLKSVLSSGKAPLTLANPTNSFSVAGPASKPYISPTLEKVLYECERPTVILVSAVGATGKTALARQLSRDTQLPILDLGKHKPVGADTLTGLLTSAFALPNIGDVLQGLAEGSYGLIVDGLDEGRSKTTAAAFAAFLDDVVKLCKTAPTTTLVILGRSQTLDDCFDHLSGAGVSTALVTISPFDMADARKYIDTFCGGGASAYVEQYTEVRDYVIGQLEKAFGVQSAPRKDGFLSFIGYPPVLDAVVTLLSEERNYHKLKQSLASDTGQDVEVGLLRRIAQYVLDRERDEKVLPNVVEPLVAEAPGALRKKALETAFSPEEQSARLVARCLGRSLTLKSIPDAGLNEKYEETLQTFLPEHPFLDGLEFRNAVFEALALATLMVSQNVDARELVEQYAATHKHSYHLVYMLDAIAADRCVPAVYVNDLVASAMEFRSVHSSVEMRIDGPAPGELDTVPGESGDVMIEIEVLIADSHDYAKTFAFCTRLASDSVLSLGPRLGGAYITVPGELILGGGRELEITAPVEVLAGSIRLEGEALVVRADRGGGKASEVILEGRTLVSRIERVSSDDVPVHLAITEGAAIGFPMHQFVDKTARQQLDPQLQEKYLRLRRILMTFRSHGKGSLARFKDKIESERVLRNAVGRAILDSLVKNGVLELRDNFYYLDPDGLNEHIGASWQDLRMGRTPPSLLAYLGGISVNE